MSSKMSFPVISIANFLISILTAISNGKNIQIKFLVISMDTMFKISNILASNGHKLEHRRFHSNIRKHFTVQVMEQGNRLPREVVGSFSLEMFKYHLVVGLGNLL